jgi:hypothetical protein
MPNYSNAYGHYNFDERWTRKDIDLFVRLINYHFDYGFETFIDTSFIEEFEEGKDFLCLFLGQGETLMSGTSNI